MYPPSTRYSLLPTDPEEHSLLPTDPEDIDLDIDIPVLKPRPTPWFHSLRNRRFHSLRNCRFAILIAGSLVVFLIAGLYWSNVFTGKHTAVFPGNTAIFPENTFIFGQESRPQWLDTPPVEPVVLRIAVMTRVDGFERRQAVREAVFQGVRKEDVSLDYRFFVGAAPKTEEGESTHRLVDEENQKFNDIVVLDEIDDIPERLSEKRYAALKWVSICPFLI